MNGSNLVQKHKFNEFYIRTSNELTNEEKKALSMVLPLFPNVVSSHYDRCNIKTFISADLSQYDAHILKLAANAYDRNGNTVLGVAAEFGDVDAVEKLIALGADLNTPDDNMNKLALHWAINNKKSFRAKDSLEAVEVVKRLLQHGARTDITCYGKSTVLDYSKSRGFTAAAHLIEQAISGLLPRNKNKIESPIGALLRNGVFTTATKDNDAVESDSLDEADDVKSDVLYV